MLICGYCGIMLFSYAFFPITYGSDDSSSKIPEGIVMHGNFIKFDPMHEFNTIDNIALVIIDALHYDFVSKEHYLNNLPYLSHLIHENSVCIYRCHVNVPTVTMPRIKSITTGTVSSFIDILLNFGNTSIKQDNIIKQAKRNNKTMIFYGDDTWLKLFPNEFNRFEGTSSFYVVDFKEVDDNVTRNVLHETKNFDWHMMILHYLGLDHIGHVEGPNSPHVPSKLMEMDSVIKLIHRYFIEREKLTKEKYMIIICGDHGMKDTGGHGGSSFSEITTPFITLGIPCSSEQTDILQVDIAPTVSLLWGLPIPYASIGRLINGITDFLPKSQQLFGYYYCIHQIMQNALYDSDLMNNEETDEYSNLINLHFKWMANNQSGDDGFESIKNGYKTLLNRISNRLLNSFTRFDTILLWAAFILMLQVTILSVLYFYVEINHVLITRIDLVLILVNIVIVRISQYALYEAIAYSLVFTLILSNIIIALFLCRRKDRKSSFNIDYVDKFLFFGTLFQICSSFSSSFVEEEHLIWYYLWTTCSLLLLIPLTPCTKKRLIFWILLLCAHRFTRNLNRTGVKWVYEPDFGDWFQSNENSHFLSIFTATSLLSIIFVCHYIDGVNKYSPFNYYVFIAEKLCLIICLCLIYLHKCAVGSVSRSLLNFTNSYRGQTEFIYFVYFTLIYALIKISRLVYVKFCYTRCGGDVSMIKMELLKIFTNLWILFCSMLCKPFNIILFSCLCFTSILTCKLLKSKINVVFKIVLIHYWLAYVFFYYQGNSNNFATVDVTPGYIGQTNYNFFNAAVLIFSNTYASCILSFLLLSLHLLDIKRKFNSDIENVVHWLLFFVNIYATIYMFVIIMHKNHLFIWSVFTPKLIYLAIYTVSIVYSYCILHQFFI